MFRTSLSGIGNNVFCRSVDFRTSRDCSAMCWFGLNRHQDFFGKHVSPDPLWGKHGSVKEI
eukprot:1640989-Heterocapsa_arctica.AAC.1